MNQKISFLFYLLFVFSIFVPVVNGVTTVSIEPSTQTVAQGETFTLSVFCSPDEPVKAFELGIFFNETLLQANEVLEGNIFSGYSTFFNDGTINNNSGEISLVYNLILGQGNVSEAGSFVIINFTAKNLNGISAISLYDVGVTNDTAYIPISVSNGSVNIFTSLPPSISSPVPSNDSTVSLTTTHVNITIEDPDEEPFDYTIQTTPNVGSCSENSVSNGQKSCVLSGLSPLTTYSWTVTATDGTHTTINTYQFTTESSGSTTHYVSNDGNDNADGGSPSTAWATIGKVNTAFGDGTIQQGDGIYFGRGDTFTDEGLFIEIGGMESNPMVIGAYGSGAKPIFDGVSISCWDTHTGYITVQDIAVRNIDGTQSIGFGAANLSNMIFSRLEIDGNTNRNCILLNRINGYIIENSTFSNCGNSGIAIIGSSTYPITNGIIRNNLVHDIGSNDGICLHKDGERNNIGPNHLLVNNTGHDCAEESFDITSGENIILLDCESYGDYNGGIAIGHEVKNVWIDNFYSHDQQPDSMGIIVGPSTGVRIRNSIVYNAGYHQLRVNGDAPGSWPGEDGTTEDVKIFNNNLIFGQDSTGCISDIAGYTSDLIYKNNIITSLVYGSPSRYQRYLQGSSVSNTNSKWNHNIWWRPDNGTTGDDRWWYENATGDIFRFPVWSSKPEVNNDLKVDPMLVDPQNENFNLQSDSPAIDAGDWLTMTIGAGSGTQLIVEDAGYYCDGFGMIDGDEIRVGSNLVGITAVDYDTNVISVNEVITWNDGDPVSLPYEGSAPDIGAFEYVSTSPDTTPPETFIDSGPSGDISTDNVTFVWHGTDDTTPQANLEYNYSLDGVWSGW
ncbi:hypothetical protein K8R43_05355, partial [archaeon]|nr:hypothetical protein [archaeon]